jgi:hypothetical protein
MLAEPPNRSTEISDTLRTFATVVERAELREVETVLAFLALNMLFRLEAGHIDPSHADRLFTLVDVQLTDLGRSNDLSPEATELLVEGHHFHHWGQAFGPDPTEIRRLAGVILARQRG